MASSEETFRLLPDPPDAAAVWAIPEGRCPRFCLRSLLRLLALIVLMTAAGTLSTIGFESDPDTAIVSFWPAAALQTVFSIWYGVYGLIAGTIGPMLGNAVLGKSALQFVPANAIQSALPGLIFRGLKLDPRLRSRRDWVLGLVVVVIGCNAMGAAAGVAETAARGQTPALAGAGYYVASWAQWLMGNAVPALVLVPLLLWSSSPTLVRQRGFFRSYWAPVDFPRLGPRHWLHVADMPMLNKLQLLAALTGILPLCVLAAVTVGDALVAAHKVTSDATLDMAQRVRDENDRHELLIRSWALELSDAKLNDTQRRQRLRQWEASTDAFDNLTVVPTADVRAGVNPMLQPELDEGFAVIFYAPVGSTEEPPPVLAAAALEYPADSYLVGRCLWRPGGALARLMEGEHSLLVHDRAGRTLFRNVPSDLDGWQVPDEAAGENVEMFRYGGHRWYAASAKIERLGWRFIVVTDARRGSAKVLSGVPQVLAAVMAVAIFGAVIASGLLARRIASRVLTIADHVSAAGARPGELKIPITGVDELGYLAGALNKMSDDLAASIRQLQTTTAEKDRLTMEMDLARRLQQSVLPENPPEVEGYELAAFCGPALDVGGDFYDYFHVPADRVAVMVGDASGKGLKASMFMSETRGIARAATLRGDLPDRALSDANRAMVPQGDLNASFVTLFCAVLDPQTHCLHFANAGHNRPLVANGQRVRSLGDAGLPIAVVAGAPYECQHAAIDPGDAIVMYTDGITEAMDVEGNLFGSERLADVLRRCRGRSAVDIRETVLAATRTFAAGRSQSDDITVVVVRRLG